MEIWQYRSANILSALFSYFCNLPKVLYLVFQYNSVVKLVQTHFSALEQRAHFSIPFLIDLFHFIPLYSVIYLMCIFAGYYQLEKNIGS